VQRSRYFLGGRQAHYPSVPLTLKIATAVQADAKTLEYLKHATEQSSDSKKLHTASRISVFYLLQWLRILPTAYNFLYEDGRSSFLN
jgi:hypothetical protein